MVHGSAIDRGSNLSICISICIYMYMQIEKSMQIDKTDPLSIVPIYLFAYTHLHAMGWLRLVGSLKL